MSRIASGDVVQVKATMDVYTGLTLVGMVIVALGLFVVYLRAGQLFDGGLTGSQQQQPPARTSSR